MIELKNDFWRVGCDPKRGCALDFGEVTLGKEKYAILASQEKRKDAPHDIPEASFLMAPWSNRLKNGKVVINEETFNLLEPEIHSLHGCVHPESWDVIEQGGASLFCSLQVVGGKNNKSWPHSFLAEYRISLVGKTLRQSLRLKNTSTETQPLGGGFHPYFNRNLREEQPSTVRLKFNLQGVYPCEEEPCLPTGMPVNDEKKLGLMAGKAVLERSFFVDDCFSGFHRLGTISWENEGVELGFACSENLGHIVCYNPDAAVFAVEPVSHCNDAYNLVPGIVSQEQSGTRYLQPGETCELQFDMTINQSVITP